MAFYNGNAIIVFLFGFSPAIYLKFPSSFPSELFHVNEMQYYLIPEIDLPDVHLKSLFSLYTFLVGGYECCFNSYQSGNYKKEVHKLYIIFFCLLSFQIQPFSHKQEKETQFKLKLDIHLI